MSWDKTTMDKIAAASSTTDPYREPGAVRFVMEQAVMLMGWFSLMKPIK